MSSSSPGRFVAVFVTVAAVAGGALAGAAGGPDRSSGDDPREPHKGRGGGPAEATWYFRPRSLAELDERTEAVVEAQVLGVRAGPDLISDAGEVGLPTQRIDVEVEDAFRSSDSRTGEGRRVTLFRTGGVSRTNGGAPLALEGDPPYRVGERYVLFLIARKDGTFIPVAPDGRLRETAEARLEPLIEGPVADELRGKTKEHVRQEASKRGGDR